MQHTLNVQDIRSTRIASAMQQDELMPDGLLVFSGPGGRNIKAKITRIIDDYLELQIIESELQTRKVGALFRAPIAYVLECGLYKLI